MQQLTPGRMFSNNPKVAKAASDAFEARMEAKDIDEVLHELILKSRLIRFEVQEILPEDLSSADIALLETVGYVHPYVRVDA